MQSNIVRIQEISFDAQAGIYGARITFAAPSGPVERQLNVAGHRSWAPAQIIAALKQSAQRS